MRESVKMVSTSLIPWKRLCRSQVCAKAEACPSVWSSKASKYASFIERVVVVACQDLICSRSHGTVNKAPLASKAKWIRDVSCIAAAKIGTPAMCKNSLLEILVLCCGRGRAQRWRPPVSVPEECCSRLLNVCVKLGACPPGQHFIINKWAFLLKKSGQYQLPLSWDLGWVSPCVRALRSHFSDH